MKIAGKEIRKRGERKKVLDQISFVLLICQANGKCQELPFFLTSKKAGEIQYLVIKAKKEIGALVRHYGLVFPAKFLANSRM